MFTAEVRQRCLHDFCDEREVRFILWVETLAILFPQVCFLGREDGVEIRPEEDCLLDGLRRAVGVHVYVGARSTPRY